MLSLIFFLVNKQCETIPIIIAHGGFSNDFPILLANCIKHSYGNYSILANCTHVDSMLMFRISREESTRRKVPGEKSTREKKYPGKIVHGKKYSGKMYLDPRSVRS